MHKRGVSVHRNRPLSEHAGKGWQTTRLQGCDDDDGDDDDDHHEDDDDDSYLGLCFLFLPTRLPAAIELR